MKLINKLLIVFAMIILTLFSVSCVSAQNSVVTNLRYSSRNDKDPPFMRVVVDLSKPVYAEAAMDNEGKNLEIILRNTSKGSIPHQYDDMDHRIIDFATVSEKDDDTYLDFALTQSQKMKNISIFALKADKNAGKPHRLVIDIPIPGAKQTIFETPKINKTEVKKSVLNGKIICIDPGHGGSDTGAIGKLDGNDVYEKTITLEVAKKLETLLTSSGAKVLMTRTGDNDVYAPFADGTTELQARADVANNNNADVFLSIHIDAFSNPEVDGTTSYYTEKTKKDFILASSLNHAVLRNTSIPDRGVRASNLYVNVHTKMPSTLIELGYISNPDRVKMLTKPWASDALAKSLYEGFEDYFKRIEEENL